MSTTRSRFAPSGNMADFFAFLADFRSLWSWIAKATVIAPLVDLSLNFGPPWPSRVGVSILMGLVELIVLAFVFEFFRHGTPRIGKMRLLMAVGACLLFIFFVLHTIIYSFFTLETGVGSERVVIGYSYHPDIESLRSSNPAYHTPKILLRKFHDVDAIWTPTSTRVMQCVMLVTWTLLWGFLALVLGVFVIAQWRHAKKRKRRRKRNKTCHP
jgi:hypothetical protein